MFEIPIKNPKPDFEALSDVVLGLKLPERVHFIEVIIDEEVKKYIVENFFHEKNLQTTPLLNTYDDDIKTAHKKYYRQLINFYYQLGYSILPDHEYVMDFYSLNPLKITAEDTATLSRGEREWIQEGGGIINSWEDFERFPWNKAYEMLAMFEEHLNFMSRIVPEGMKIAVVGAVFAPIVTWMLGFKGLFYKLYDDMDLVKEVFERVGNIFLKMYTLTAQTDIVGVLWHGDDLGFKTSTMLSPEHLRNLVFPWFKKYAAIAHEHGKLFWIHCCGYKNDIMADFIDEIKADALHSFEDTSCPVVEYKERYGERIALLGGVDVDKLCRLEEKELRIYIRSILDICMKGGRYALGSGNSITNYLPVRNYFIMLEEGYNYWK